LKVKERTDAQPTLKRGLATEIGIPLAVLALDKGYDVAKGWVASKKPEHKPPAKGT
jgi:hypothetical protein